MAESLINDEELATRVFKITIVSAVLFIGAVIWFIL
jgi:hypothetical protein